MPVDQRKADWVRSVLGIALASPTQSGAATGMIQWQTARTQAIASLTRLGAAIAKAKLVDAAPAIVLLMAIRANLTEKPATPQQIKELRRYLNDDDIITTAESRNGYGVQITLREPLLKALDALELEVAA